MKQKQCHCLGNFLRTGHLRAYMLQWSNRTVEDLNATYTQAEISDSSSSLVAKFVANRRPPLSFRSHPRPHQSQHRRPSQPRELPIIRRSLISIPAAPGSTMAGSVPLRQRAEYWLCRAVAISLRVVEIVNTAFIALNAVLQDIQAHLSSRQDHDGRRL